jgi:uncharacterized protein
MRLFCDEMLLRLGRWLRAAGYDTATAAGGLGDRELIRRCAAEGRILLTRDRQLAARARSAVAVMPLAAGGIAAQAGALKAALGIDWERAPFTRCLVDNAPLAAARAAALAEVPPASRAAAFPLLRCPECHRLYWPGGHVRRMRARLALWNHPSSGAP